jgi:hypothetical protein
MQTPPPPLGHPPYVIMPYYLYTIVEKFLYRYFRGIACAPTVEERNAFFIYLGSDDPQYPQRGQGWRKRGGYFLKKIGFLQSRKKQLMEGSWPASCPLSYEGQE